MDTIIELFYGNSWSCLTYNQYKELNENEDYEVYIDSVKYDGSLTYGDLVIPYIIGVFSIYFNINFNISQLSKHFLLFK